MNAPAKRRLKAMIERRGMMLLEVAVSVLLVGVLLALSVQVLGWTARERRSADRRAAALVEAGNQLDELSALPWNDITPDRLKTAQLSPEAIALLPEAKLEVTLTRPDDDATAKQITVSIDWQGNHGEREAPVRLTTWVYEGAKE